ncbi:MAG: DUF167 domain-containing protein [Dehalococcoidales bacterium]|nr:DUF167 domain-containing protein [Dehalococcoidales bacterium]
MPSQQEPTRIIVRVRPGARKNEVLGFLEDVLRVKIAAPPVEGKANRELIVFLSEVLGIRKSDITIEKGETAKRKVVGIIGVTQSQIMERVAARSAARAPKLL